MSPAGGNAESEPLGLTDQGAGVAREGTYDDRRQHGTWFERVLFMLPNSESATVMRQPEIGVEPDPSSTIRALRDLEAARARVERDASRVYDDTRSKLVAELLPVLDNLDRTIRAAAATSASAALVEGVRRVRTQLECVLRGYGVERIDAVGARFDPSVHEAVSVIAIRDPARHAFVLDQAEPGYRFGDRLLRPAKVVVGRSTV